MYIHILTGVSAILLMLYFTSSSFRFRCKAYSFNLYLLVGAMVVVPFMLLNGRSRKNVIWCKRVLLVSGKIFGLQSHIRNGDNLILDGPSVIVSNHQCALDLSGMGKLISERSTVTAKKALMYAGPFGLALWLSGFIFIERSKRKESREVMDKVADTVKNEGLCVWVFPEGTRSMGDEMLPFKRGAFNLAVKAQVPIVPVVYSSYKKFYNPAKHLFNGGDYIIEVMSPVSTTGLTVDDVPNLADDTRLKMMDTFRKISNMDNHCVD